MNVGSLLWGLMYSLIYAGPWKDMVGVEREMTSHAYAFKHLVPPLVELCGDAIEPSGGGALLEGTVTRDGLWGFLLSSALHLSLVCVWLRCDFSVSCSCRYALPIMMNT